MKVFVTGASGWIGSAVVDELLAHGHEVEGLARSDASAQSLEAKGASVRRGDLDDPAGLAAGAEAADAVVHLANKHDWGNPAESNRAERAAVESIGTALEGSDKRLLIASGVAFAPGEMITERDVNPAEGPAAPRGGTEQLALSFAGRGIRPTSVRFAPTVHGTGGDHGFIAAVAQSMRSRDSAGYLGDGANRWSAVHRLDAARLVRLALEHHDIPIVHAIAETGVPTRDIAAALGAANGWPVDSAPADAFGWVGRFWGMDLPADSTLTRETLGWEPTGPTLVEDIAAGGYPGT